MTNRRDRRKAQRTGDKIAEGMAAAMLLAALGEAMQKHPVQVDPDAEGKRLAARLIAAVHHPDAQHEHIMHVVDAIPDEESLTATLVAALYTVAAGYVAGILNVLNEYEDDSDETTESALIEEAAATAANLTADPDLEN